MDEWTDEQWLALLAAEQYREARILPGDRWAALSPLMFTTAVVTGEIGDVNYSNRWCYHSPTVASEELAAWSGEGEPGRWHRNPITGRRVCESERCVGDGGVIVGRGEMYTAF